MQVVLLPITLWYIYVIIYSITVIDGITENLWWSIFHYKQDYFIDLYNHIYLSNDSLINQLVKLFHFNLHFHLADSIRRFLFISSLAISECQHWRTIWSSDKSLYWSFWLCCQAPAAAAVPAPGSNGTERCTYIYEWWVQESQAMWDEDAGSTRRPGGTFPYLSSTSNCVQSASPRRWPCKPITCRWD